MSEQVRKLAEDMIGMMAQRKAADDPRTRRCGTQSEDGDDDPLNQLLTAVGPIAARQILLAGRQGEQVYEALGRAALAAAGGVENTVTLKFSQHVDGDVHGIACAVRNDITGHINHDELMGAVAAALKKEFNGDAKKALAFLLKHKIGRP